LEKNHKDTKNTKVFPSARITVLKAKHFSIIYFIEEIFVLFVV